MKKILVVEDESSIRELVVLNMEMADYEVVQAASAEEALQLFTAAPESFSCAILDIMLPGMNGFLCVIISVRCVQLIRQRRFFQPLTVTTSA